jgi:pyridoxamine 5'-phosphate oxidase
LDISYLRGKYTTRNLEVDQMEECPFKQFELWFKDALDAELCEPNAFALSTVGKDMMPSSRNVLLKTFDLDGFVFFTNYKSDKANHIDENPQAAALFSYLELERQIKIQGKIEKIPTTQSLKYFLSRPKGSQLGAWVSHQSSIISSRSLLEQKFDEIKRKFSNNEIPFPDFWGGYVIVPTKIEFWQGGDNRLHDRFLYELQDDNSWTIKRLAP